MTGPNVRKGYKRRTRSRSAQDANVVSKAWDAFDPNIHPEWNVEKGHYWKMGDSIWHPEGAWGRKLTIKLERRVRSQIRWIFERGPLGFMRAGVIREMRRTGNVEGVLSRVFKEAGKEDLLYGTVREASARVGRMKLARRP